MVGTVRLLGKAHLTNPHRWLESNQLDQMLVFQTSCTNTDQSNAKPSRSELQCLSSGLRASVNDLKTICEANVMVAAHMMLLVDRPLRLHAYDCSRVLRHLRTTRASHPACTQRQRQRQRLQQAFAVCSSFKDRVQTGAN